MRWLSNEIGTMDMFLAEVNCLSPLITVAAFAAFAAKAAQRTAHH